MQAIIRRIAPEKKPEKSQFRIEIEEEMTALATKVYLRAIEKNKLQQKLNKKLNQ